VTKYREIWANIEAMLIKYKFKSMLPSDDLFIRQKASQGYALTEKDLQLAVR
jgi:hypothetical protein